MRKLSVTMMCAVLTTMMFSGCAARHISMAPKVPDLLNVQKNQLLSFALRGVGVQIYACKAVKNDPARFDWAFIAPEAVLLDNQGNKVGKHYAGPTWEANDGSKVVGQVLAKDKGPVLFPGCCCVRKHMQGPASSARLPAFSASIPEAAKRLRPAALRQRPAQRYGYHTRRIIIFMPPDIDRTEASLRAGLSC